MGELEESLRESREGWEQEGGCRCRGWRFGWRSALRVGLGGCGRRLGEWRSWLEMVRDGFGEMDWEDGGVRRVLKWSEMADRACW